MTKQQVKALVIFCLVILVGIVAVQLWSRKYKGQSETEDYSYHFGFPTWGGINAAPWNYGWGGIRRFNPFLGLGFGPYGDYYDRSIGPYLATRCYTSSDDDVCVPHYRKIGTDTDADGVKDKWKCCRRNMW